jgi:hypothetical protein
MPTGWLWLIVGMGTLLEWLLELSKFSLQTLSDLLSPERERKKEVEVLTVSSFTFSARRIYSKSAQF